MLNSVGYIIIVALYLLDTSVIADYWEERLKLINLEKLEAVGARLNLSSKESQFNDILMQHKLQELDDGFKNPGNFLPAMHFFKSKSRIEESEVFKIIRKIPKGASLHVHDTALTSGEFIYNLTYSENLYGCVKDGRLFLQFFVNDTFCSWTPISVLRKNDKSFDNFLKTQINIIVDEPSLIYPTAREAWHRLEDTFETIGPMLYYEPVFRQYFYQALKEFYEDNVMYLEFRSPMHHLYDSQGKSRERVYIMELYLEIINEFKKNYPNFHGAKMIYSPKREIDNKTLTSYIQTALNLKGKYPNFVVGFDLVGQEDDMPLAEFVPQLLKLREEMPFFFHAGETNWNGMSTDLNLVDAVLLNVTRIGHGYGLLKHQQVLSAVKDKGIAVEVNPLSNQVLKLVDDMRNHPASVLMNRGFNVVICCDDPSFWGARGLSYDWYMAYMGMASRDSDLRFLKQLAINSILYSALGLQEKQEVMDQWEQQWQNFLDEMLKEIS